MVHLSQLELTVKEAVALELLREAIPDVLEDDKDYDDDFNLIRWLRSRNMDPKKAEIMLRNSIAWRKDNHINELLYAPLPLDIIERFPVAIDGEAKDGSMVGSALVGQIDFLGLLRELGTEKVIKYCHQMCIQAEKVVLERNRERREANPEDKTFKGVLLIVDCKNFSYRQLIDVKAIQLGIEMASSLVNYFPDMASRMVLINCNRFARMAIKIAKPILESTTLKLEVYGEDRKEWTAAILKQIDSDQIRVPFGGTKKEKFIFVTPDYLVTLQEQHRQSKTTL